MTISIKSNWKTYATETFTLNFSHKPNFNKKIEKLVL